MAPPRLCRPSASDLVAGILFSFVVVVFPVLFPFLVSLVFSTFRQKR